MYILLVNRYYLKFYKYEQRYAGSVASTEEEGKEGDEDNGSTLKN